MSIPSHQSAAQVHAFGEPLRIGGGFPVKQPEDLAPGECLIKIDYAGVCQTDVHARKGDLAFKPSIPLIGGHEGVGTVVAIGKHTLGSMIKIGDRVGLKWLARTCLQCEYCRKGVESSCPHASVNGYTVDGTFAEYTVSWVDYVTPIPESLDGPTATAILCAGLTVYRGVRQCNAVAGEWIAISGAGGGLGHLAVQYARNMGLRVIAIDTGEDKKHLCLQLGAEKWIDFRESKDVIADVVQASDGLGPHAAVVTANVALPFNQAVIYLRPLGTLVALGLPGTACLNVQIDSFIAKNLKIVGSAIGSRQHAIEALAIAAQGRVKCHYTLKKLEDLNSVFDDMEEGKIIGKTVIKL